MTAATTSLRERLRIIATDYEPGSILRATVEEAIAALSTPPAGKWMPIASAPKDGTDMLIFVAKSGEQFVAFWIDAWLYAQTNSGVRVFTKEATHWQPLPPPPEPATQEVG